MLNASEHVLQAVPELVEERLYFSEGHQRGLSGHWGRAVAGQVGNRLAAHHFALSNANVHPCATSLVRRARIRIQIERSNMLAGFIVLEKFTLLTPEILSQLFPSKITI